MTKRSSETPISHGSTETSDGPSSLSGVSVKVIYGPAVVRPASVSRSLDNILNLLPIYGPVEIRRSLFHWVVGRQYDGYGDSGFDVDHRFWTKSAATAELVRLALQGQQVRF